jgi:hypothetical protein
MRRKIEHTYLNVSNLHRKWQGVGRSTVTRGARASAAPARPRRPRTAPSTLSRPRAHGADAVATERPPPRTRAPVGML